MCGFSPVSDSPGFSLSELYMLSLLQFIKYSSGFPALTLVPAQISFLVSYDSLYSLVGLSNLGDNGLSCDLFLQFFTILVLQ